MTHRMKYPKSAASHPLRLLLTFRLDAYLGGVGGLGGGRHPRLREQPG